MFAFLCQKNKHVHHIIVNPTIILAKSLKSLRRVRAMCGGLTDERERDRPQFLCGIRVNRPLFNAVAIFEQVGVVVYGVSLLAVSKIVPAGVGEFGGDCRDEGGGGTLLEQFCRRRLPRPRRRPSNLFVSV